VRLELASIHAPGSDHTMGRKTQPAKDSRRDARREIGSSEAGDGGS
jgi:hypothetical protein